MEHIFGQDHKKTAMSMPQMGALPVIKCLNCGGIFFENAFLLRVLSSIVSPDGQERIIPDPVFVCKSCQTVLGSGGDDKEELENDMKNSDVEQTEESLLDVEEVDVDKPQLKLV